MRCLFPNQTCDFMMPNKWKSMFSWFVRVTFGAVLLKTGKNLTHTVKHKCLSCVSLHGTDECKLSVSMLLTVLFPGLLPPQECHC